MGAINDGAVRVLKPEGQEALRAAPLPHSIPGLDFGGAGQPLHFLHANGYPPACYGPLIERLLPDLHVFGMLLRPLWPDADPKMIRDWRPFSDDLRSFLRQTKADKVIGLGHSIGAVTTLRAAIEEPGLFRALILMDPVLLPPYRVVQLRIAHALGIQPVGRRLIEGALRRRTQFDDQEQMFAGYRRREIFRYFSDESLSALVQGLTRPREDGGYELVYSPKWEARIYATGMWSDWDLWTGIRNLRMPILFLRGQQTDTFFVETAKIAQKRNPAVQVETIPEATHLVPLEKPAEVAEAVKRFVGGLEQVAP